MTVADGLSHAVTRWAQLYNDKRAVSAAVTYAHFAGVLLGGGFAVVADRDALRLSPAIVAARPLDLESLAHVHRWVLWGLALMFVSGLLMTLADVHTYLASSVFWTKMGLIVLLLGNGYGRVRAERAVASGSVAGWRLLRRTSVASLVLWFAVLLVSTILNASP